MSYYSCFIFASLDIELEYCFKQRLFICAVQLWSLFVSFESPGSKGKYYLITDITLLEPKLDLLSLAIDIHLMSLRHWVLNV